MSACRFVPPPETSTAVLTLMPAPPLRRRERLRRACRRPRPPARSARSGLVGLVCGTMAHMPTPMLKVLNMSRSGMPPDLASMREDGRGLDGLFLDARRQARGQGAGDVFIEAAAGDVADGAHVHLLHQRQYGLYIDARGRQQRLADAHAQFLGEDAASRGFPHRTRVRTSEKPLECTPEEGRAMRTSPACTCSRSSDLCAVDHADAETGQVVLIFRVEAGHFGGFAAHQRAAGLHAALAHALDDVGDALGHVLAAGDVVEEEQRLCARSRPRR